MKNPTSRCLPGVGFSSSTKSIRDFETVNVPANPSPNQDALSQLAEGGIPITSFWKSPRNRREAVQVSLRSYEGHPFLDARVYTADASGRMVPTQRGLAIGIKTLPLLAKAIGDGLRRAHALGLTAGSSS